MKRILAVSVLGLLLIALMPGWASATSTCFGESGPDGTSGNDTFGGATSGHDVWSGLGGDDSADGQQGHDYLCGDAGADGTNSAPGGGYWLGGSDEDKLLGGGGHDILKGEGGGDTVLGGVQDDVLYGMDQDDYLDGGDDLDVDDIHAGAGNGDVCVARWNDIYYNGECEDFVDP